jgi:hypothetical protein
MLTFHAGGFHGTIIKIVSQGAYQEGRSILIYEKRRGDSPAFH